MDKETLLKLYAELGSMSAVARHLGKSNTTVLYHFRKHGIHTKSGFKSPKSIRHYSTDHKNWKGGTYKSGGYIQEYAPDHPKNSKGYVPQHRLVMEKHLGRYLDSTEVVHHINGDKLDNRLETLVVLTRKAHMNIHKTERDELGRFIK